MFRRKRDIDAPEQVDTSEAQSALQRSREARERVKSRQTIVLSVSSSLRVAREKNHIAEGMHNLLYGR